MEIDSTLAAVALTISLLSFTAAGIIEASVASLRRERVQRLVAEGSSGSVYLDRLHISPLGPTAALSLIKHISLAGALVSSAAVVIAGPGVDWRVIAPVSAGTLVLLGLASVAGRALALAYGELIALKTAFGVHKLAWVMNPLTGIQGTLARRAMGVVGQESGFAPDQAPTELDLGLDSNGEPVDEREARMIRGVVRLDQTTAREIMVPRGDMVAVDIGTSIAELAEQMIRGGHSRIPIFRGDSDHIEGIAYARDVLRHLARGEQPPTAAVETVVRPALYIPESKTLEELLSEFQQRRVHMAIVVDEYGGVSGLVTIEDLLEEIVGEIQDEFDVGDPEIEVVGEKEFMMDARVSVDQLEELLSVAVEGEGFDTLGGFVYQRLGKIPSPGDSVEYDGLKIEVISTIGRRLKRLKVTTSTSQESLPQ